MQLRTSLGRVLDPATPSNLFIIVATPAVGAIAGVVALIAGERLVSAAATGFFAGGAAFLGWALAREIDPDRTATAGVAALLAPLVVAMGRPDLLGCALLILAARLVVGSTGWPPSAIDAGVVGALATLVPLRRAGMPIGVVAAMALAAAAWWHRDRARGLLATGSAAFLGVAIVSAVTDPDAGVPLDEIELGVFVAGTVAGIVAIAMVPRVRSVTDGGSREVILEMRIRLARAAVALASVGAASWAGRAGIHSLGPAWAALAVTAVMSVAALGDSEVRSAG